MKIRPILSSIFSRQLHLISRSRTDIKPASPTPSNLKQYKLPSYDSVMPTIYIPMLFFYPNYSFKRSTLQPNNIRETRTRSNLLKNSLSETLSIYYPFAGRLRSQSHIHCSDEGIDFFEARIGCNLSEVLGNAHVKDNNFAGPLFPPSSIWDAIPSQESSLVRVQLNYFDCGGLAIAASVSHKLGDAATMCSFLRYWANLSRHSGDHQKLIHIRPHYAYELALQSIFDDSIKSELCFAAKNWITKEIVFNNAKISTLKETVNVQDKLVEDKKYTRNELLTALLYRCSVTAAAAASESGAYAPSVLLRTVNIRPMMEPPLPETSVGNLVGAIHIPTTTESETNLNQLVGRMRKGKMKLKGIKSIDGFKPIPPMLLEYLKSNRRAVVISSICNFPIYKEMDFGWGMPIKATLVDGAFAGFITLIDTASGDGIKAVVNLEEKEMEEFLKNKELLTYASL